MGFTFYGQVVGSISSVGIGIFTSYHSLGYGASSDIVSSVVSLDGKYQASEE